MSHRPAAKKQSKIFERLLFLTIVLVIGVLIYFGLQWKHSIFSVLGLRKNFIIRTNPVILVSFPEEENEQNLILTIPSNVYTKVPFGYGPYKLESVARLGELENKPELFVNTVEDLLGLSFDGWISYDNDFKQEIQSIQDLEQLKKVIYLSVFINRSHKTNLNFLDQLILVWKLFQLKPTNSGFFNLEENNSLFTESILPDKTPVRQINEKALERFMEQKFESQKIRKDGLSIKILNATQVQGAGNTFSRFLTSLGGKVIGIGNQKDEVERCKIKTGETNVKAGIVLYLKNKFNCEVATTQENLDADIIVIVGDYFAQRWN